MIEAQVLAITFVIMRVASLVTFFPVMSDSRIPALVKVGLAITLGWMLYNSLPDVILAQVAASTASWPRVIMSAVTEVLFGAALGFAFGVLLEPARIAGSYIGQELGLNMAAIADPGSASSANVVGRIVESWAVILFFALNLHHVFLRVTRLSLEVFPVGQGTLKIPAPAVAYQADLLTAWGLMIASPVGICVLVAVIALALLMRAVPQMNIFAVGLSIRLAVGLGATVIFLPVMLNILIRVVRQAEYVFPTFVSN